MALRRPLDKGWSPQTLFLTRVAHPQPFTSLSACPLTRVPPPTPSRAGADPVLDKGCATPSFHELEHLPFFPFRRFPPVTKKTTASSGTARRTLQHSLPESPSQNGTDTQKAHMLCCLFSTTPATQPHRKPSASSGTHEDCLTESPHETLPAQPQRKEHS